MADSLNSSISEDNDSLDGYYGNGRQGLDYGNVPQFAGLTRSDSKTRRKTLVRACPDTEDLLNLLHGSDPVKVELNRLENEVRDKDRKLAEATAECKALKLAERLREKAVEELSEELDKVDEKLKAAEDLLESKNLELKKLNDEKKAAWAAQFAAEGARSSERGGNAVY
jgi:chromosome segregation ATPase